jgi:hypothetical protein
VSANGTVTGVSAGQAIIVASVTRSAAIQDSMLAVIAPSGGVVLISSVDRFDYGTNQTITLSLYVDMHTSSKRLGSTTIDVAWNPSQMIYQSFTSGGSGVSITPNANNATNGQFTLAMADVNGFNGKVELVRLTFKTSASATTGSFALTAREMTSSDLSTNLLSTLVQVANPLFVH